MNVNVIVNFIERSVSVKANERNLFVCFSERLPNINEQERAAQLKYENVLLPHEVY